jgi:hypothetical protein
MAGWSDSGFGFRPMSRGAVVLLCVLSVTAGWREDALVAQDKTMTLHVYADLIQIPVLVLSPAHERISPIAAERFSVSVDGGPEFRATHVRQEGDDPISLSILLDVSGPQTELMPKIDRAIAGLAPLSLQPRDRVSIYVLGCLLTRSLKDVSAERESLERGVDTALRQGWTDRGHDRHGADCQQRVDLWDALAYLTGTMHDLPGRRVVLAVTDGKDQGSARTWREMTTYAQGMGVAIFGLSYTPYVPRRSQRPGLSSSLFASVCELTGGMTFTANDGDMAAKLRWFTTILRERYIVEFPRPSNSTAGQHILTVLIEKSNAFIRAAGISFPLRDPSVLADPTTVPSDPSHEPELGTHHVLPVPQ